MSNARVNTTTLQETILLTPSGGDDTALIQAALARGPVQLSEGTFLLASGPLYLTGTEGTGGHSLTGAGAWKTKLLRTATTAGVGSNTFGSATDTYAVDAAIILTHGNGLHAFHVTLRGFMIESDASNNAYAIYHPRASQLDFTDIVTYQFQYGQVTYDTWLSNFTKVVHYGTGRTSWIGFYWADDGYGGGTGTTCTFQGCWARDGTGTGWKIVGLNYSALIDCAADNITGTCYSIETSYITMIGCGLENTTPAAASRSILWINSRGAMIGCRAYLINGAALSTFALFDSSRVTVQNCLFPNYTSASTAYNIGVQNGAHLTEIGTGWPTNGDTFISYTTSSRTILTDGKMTLIGAAGIAALADYADDVAAAAGGIVVGQMYRTASAVKIRVA